MIEWKDIPGYEGIYQASTDGRIRTCEGKVTTSVRHGIRHWKQRELRQHYTKRGQGKHDDARVTLWKDKKPHYHLTSRLIAMTWCDGYSPGMTVNHIDGNPRNNRSDNLEWVSLAENIRKGFEGGLFPQNHCVVVEPDGSEKHFRSYAEASRYLGRNSGYVSNLLAKGVDTHVGNRIVIPF